MVNQKIIPLIFIAYICMYTYGTVENKLKKECKAKAKQEYGINKNMRNHHIKPLAYCCDCVCLFVYVSTFVVRVDDFLYILAQKNFVLISETLFRK